MRTAHGATLSIGVTVICTGLPVLLTDHHAFAISLIILGVGIAASSFLMPKAVASPDVSLDLVLPSSLVLTASGADAFDVEIASISTGDSVRDYLDAFHVPGRGKVTGAIVTKATEATFPMTPLVRVGESKEVAPTILDSLFGRELGPLTIVQYLTRKMQQRRNDEMRELTEEANPKPMPRDKYEQRFKRLDRAIEERLSVTYCDKPARVKGRSCWRKIETLYYDPRQIPPTLYIRHAGEPTRLTPA
jgi:hypothetical protein